MFDRQSPETLSAYAADYGLLHDVQAATLHQYKVCCRLFDAWAGHAVRLDELDERSLSLFLAHYSASGVSPSTVRAKRVQLLSLWRAASDEGFCDLPTKRIRPAKVPWRAPVAWTMDEVVQLLAACDTLPRLHSCGLRRSEWFSLAIRVGWDLGLRWAAEPPMWSCSRRGPPPATSATPPARPSPRDITSTPRSSTGNSSVRLNYLSVLHNPYPPPPKYGGVWTRAALPQERRSGSSHRTACGETTKPKLGGRKMILRDWLKQRAMLSELYVDGVPQPIGVYLRGCGLLKVRAVITTSDTLLVRVPAMTGDRKHLLQTESRTGSTLSALRD